MEEIITTLKLEHKDLTVIGKPTKGLAMIVDFTEDSRLWPIVFIALGFTSDSRIVRTLGRLVKLGPIYNNEFPLQAGLADYIPGGVNIYRLHTTIAWGSAISQVVLALDNQRKDGAYHLCKYVPGLKKPNFDPESWLSPA